ncbi:unnamed protein product [Aphanomyces euteiches]
MTTTHDVHALCFGAGRFLRAVLVPAFRHLDLGVVVVQTRGDDFVKQCKQDGCTYEVDTVQRDGVVSTETIELVDVTTLGSPAHRDALFARIPQLSKLKYIGVGVTESGIHEKSQAMKDLAKFLVSFSNAHPAKHLSIINTDNLRANGDMIKKCVLANVPADYAAPFATYIKSQLTFHNSMVDRITAARLHNNFVPYAEPLPTKALVIEDLQKVLPAQWVSIPGVVIRTEPGALDKDHSLKLGIANATHTAMVYCLALSKIANTTATPLLVMNYLDGLYQRDLAPALLSQGIPQDLIDSVYADWSHRLRHQFFGMDTFFVAQNATAKYRIRLLSTVAPLIETNPNYTPSAYLAFATASLLRFLTPSEDSFEVTPRGNVFVGHMDEVPSPEPLEWTYVSGLTANLQTGRYQFRDGDDGQIPQFLVKMTETSKNASPEIIHQVLALIGGDLVNDSRWINFALDVAVLYNRLHQHTPALEVLAEVVNQSTIPLADQAAIAKCVEKAVADTWVIDVHTHLFPPTHSSLMLWGIDALLTYHYLVAEYFTTSSVSPEDFFTWKIQAQADAIWKHLFVQRSPISEACQGVITTLNALGLKELVARRDLPAIRAWFVAQDPSKYVDLVFSIAKIRYVVMTNIPFEPEEAKYWLEQTPYNAHQFKTALRVDQVLLGDWKSLGPALDLRNLPYTLAGVKAYLLAWIDIFQPVYFMASVPASFELVDAPLDVKAVQPSGAMMLQHVLLPLAASLKLPLALKFGALRQMNPRLRLAGDGVAVTDVSILTRLATQNPKVKFLATFLSRVNQHEVTVVATKFQNVHLYGCWWYCNNPSIIQELTRMRLELLGTAFTSQHSDARVLDQLIYKWRHFRTLLVEALVPLYSQLHRNGWAVSATDISRDVERLLGHSYEEFLAKTL